MADLFATPCPRCGAAAGAPCRRPNGRVVGPEHAHAGRKKAAAAPDVPEDVAERLIDPEAQQLYRSVVGELERRDEATPWTRQLAFRAARNAQEATIAFEQAADAGVVLGSTGQEVAHPLWSVALRLQERVLADLKALRMTPDSAGWTSAGGAEAKDDLDDLDELAAKRQAQAPARRKRGA